MVTEYLFHVEPNASLETHVDANTNSDNSRVVIFHLDEVKKIKVDQLRKELRLRGLSHRGLKVELIELLHKACEDKALLVNVSTTSVGPSGFDEKAKWKLLLGLEEAKEPKSLDPLQVEPGMARDQRRRDDVGDGDVCMKKFNYLEKFQREEISATALQLVVDECSEKVNTKTKASKKRKATITTTRKYDKLPIEYLIPNIKFVEKHHLNEHSHPADWY